MIPRASGKNDVYVLASYTVYSYKRMLTFSNLIALHRLAPRLSRSWKADQMPRTESLELSTDGRFNVAILAPDESSSN